MLDRIGPVTNSLLDKVIQELQKKETQDKIFDKIINPLMKDIAMRYYPFFVMMIIILILIIALLASILITMIIQRRENKRHFLYDMNNINPNIIG